MTWLKRFRPALYVLGVVLVVGSMLGARALTAGNGAEAPKTTAPSGNIGKGSGPLVLGTVDSDPPPIAFGLPPVLQSGTVSEVFVKDGQEIKEGGEKLYAFDTSIQQRDLERAQVAVKMAEAKVTEAKEAVKQHAKKVGVVVQGVALAKRRSDLAAGKYNLIRTTTFRLYKAEAFPENTWEDRLKDEPKAFEAQSEWNLAIGDWELRKAELEALEAAGATTANLVTQADIAVKQAQAEVAKAQTAIDLCTVRAKIPGTIEQITISPGATLGISTPKPALWLIPSSSRVIRAEVEADFAHRVSSNLIGKEVTIYDNSDPRLTYKGRVRRIGGTFLSKRSAADAILGNDTRVLEAVVEVIDKPSADQPPLRVGQRVRVDLGQ